MTQVWLVVRALNRGAAYSPSPRVIGEAEIFAADRESRREREAVEASAEVHEERLPPAGRMRVGGLFRAESRELALAHGFRTLEEALDLARFAGFLPLRYVLMKSGYTRCFSTDKVEPISDELSTLHYGAVLRPYPYEIMHLDERLAALKSDELVQRLLRAAHWERRADLGGDPHIAAVVRWFALEAIWKKDDGNIDPQVRWALGFPAGHREREVEPSLMAALKAEPRWELWRRRLDGAVTRLRTLRHSVVHNGFAPLEIPLPDLVFFDVLSRACLKASTGLALHAAQTGIHNQRDLLARLPEIFSTYRTAEDIRSAQVAKLDACVEEAAKWGGLSFTL